MNKCFVQQFLCVKNDVYGGDMWLLSYS